MKEYHKIQTVFKRDPNTKHKTLLFGVYSMPEFEYLSECDWIFTEKVDGTNIRVMYQDGEITFGGRTDRARIPAQLASVLEEKFLPRKAQFMEQFPDGVCFYGEGYGAKIQKGGGNYRSDQSFVLFDIKVGKWWLKRQSVEEIGRDYDCEVVPIIGSGTIYDMVLKVQDGFDSRWGNFIAEGIVARPRVELFGRNGNRIITKLKYKDFVQCMCDICNTVRSVIT